MVQRRNKAGFGNRMLIYLTPALMDVVLSQFIFVNSVRLAKMGLSASRVAGVVTVWGVVYLMTCLLLGRVVTVANSTRVILVGTPAFAVLCALSMVLSSSVAAYILVGISGILTAMFFVPFQVFMKAVDTAQSKPLTYSTGLYTFSWSMGFAMGPFIAGFLMECGGAIRPGVESYGWKLSFALSAAFCLVVSGLIAALRHLRKPVAQGGASGEMITPAVGAIDYTRLPDFAWLGWLTAGIGVIVLSFVRGVFPVRAVAVLGLSPGLLGTIFFLVSLTQAFTGLALGRGRLWMYRAWPAVVFGLLGVGGILCLGVASSPWVLCLGASLFGVYTGSFFFFLVFHALTHPSRSAQYVAVNESVIGFAGIVGPMLGGILADHAGFGAAYVVAAAMITGVVAVQAAVHTLTMKHCGNIE